MTSFASKRRGKSLTYDVEWNVAKFGGQLRVERGLEMALRNVRGDVQRV